MACSNIFDAFKQAGESLQKEIYRQATVKNPFLNFVPRGTYKKGTGLVQTRFKIANVYPDSDERSWDNYTLATGSNAGACATNFTDYDVGFEEQTYSPQHMQLRGPLLCKDEAYFSTYSDEFLTAYVEELGKVADNELGNRILKGYYDLVPKMIADPNGTMTAAGAGLTSMTAATGDINQELLDMAAIHLIDSGATNTNSNGFITLANGGPVFPLMIGMQASQGILLANSNLRTDLRETQSEAGKLFTRLGANVALKNFRHIQMLRPPRFSFSGGTYTRVNTYVKQSTTKGQEYVVNPAWKTADYEMAIVLNPAVMSWEWVQPQATVGTTRWNPMSYMGDWQFITGSEACATDGSGYDPFGKYGRHIAEIAGAVAPGANQESGLAIIFKRCHLSTATMTTCT